MRFLLPCLAALSLTTACQRGQQEPENGAPQAVANDANDPAALARRFSPLLRGVWVKADYVAELGRSRSPFLAAGQLRDVVALALAPERRRGDSLLVEANLNNHEAEQFRLYFRPGQRADALATSRVDYERPRGFYELAVTVEGADTTLHWQHYSRNARLLETTVFRRVPGLAATAGSAGEAVPRVAHAQVLAGSYFATDSLGRHHRVRLRPDGTVQGLPGVRAYRAATDFVVTLANNRDNLVLNPGSRRPQLCTYGFRGDTLRVYAARIVEPELRQGRLRYTLVRQP
ncbi:hypothetical protein [Hymenobacter sp. B81]|uniref:hypothetical protein n=1 Tax=Hymenobacter sp. B81 TaxID=3344878 RepID=UPI0037DCEEE5